MPSAVLMHGHVYIVDTQRTRLSDLGLDRNAVPNARYAPGTNIPLSGANGLGFNFAPHNNISTEAKQALLKQDIDHLPYQQKPYGDWTANVKLMEVQPPQGMSPGDATAFLNNIDHSKGGYKDPKLAEELLAKHHDFAHQRAAAIERASGVSPHATVTEDMMYKANTLGNGFTVTQQGTSITLTDNKSISHSSATFTAEPHPDYPDRIQIRTTRTGDATPAMLDAASKLTGHDNSLSRREGIVTLSSDRIAIIADGLPAARRANMEGQVIADQVVRRALSGAGADSNATEKIAGERHTPSSDIAPAHRSGPDDFDSLIHAKRNPANIALGEIQRAQAETMVGVMQERRLLPNGIEPRDIVRDAGSGASMRGFQEEAKRIKEFRGEVEKLREASQPPAKQYAGDIIQRNEAIKEQAHANIRDRQLGKDLETVRRQNPELSFSSDERILTDIGRLSETGQAVTTENLSRLREEELGGDAFSNLINKKQTQGTDSPSSTPETHPVKVDAHPDTTSTHSANPSSTLEANPLNGADHPTSSPPSSAPSHPSTTEPLSDFDRLIEKKPGIQTTANPSTSSPATVSDMPPAVGGDHASTVPPSSELPKTAPVLGEGVAHGTDVPKADLSSSHASQTSTPGGSAHGTGKLNPTPAKGVGKGGVFGMVVAGGTAAYSLFKGKPAEAAVAAAGIVPGGATAATALTGGNAEDIKHAAAEEAKGMVGGALAGAAFGSVAGPVGAGAGMLVGGTIATLDLEAATDRKHSPQLLSPQGQADFAATLDRLPTETHSSMSAPMKEMIRDNNAMVASNAAAEADPKNPELAKTAEAASEKLVETYTGLLDDPKKMSQVKNDLTLSESMRQAGVNPSHFNAKEADNGNKAPAQAREHVMSAAEGRAAARG